MLTTMLTVPQKSLAGDPSNKNVYMVANTAPELEYIANRILPIGPVALSHPIKMKQDK